MNVFREDVAALVPHLRAFARSLTGGDLHLADDIVQDTIVNALQAQHQFTPGTNLKAWLFTILRNRFRSVIARKHVTAEVAMTISSGMHGLLPSRKAGSRLLLSTCVQDAERYPSRGAGAYRRAWFSLRSDR